MGKQFKIGDVVDRFWDGTMIRVSSISYERYASGDLCRILNGKRIACGIESGQTLGFVADDCRVVD